MDRFLLIHMLFINGMWVCGNKMNNFTQNIYRRKGGIINFQSGFMMNSWTSCPALYLGGVSNVRF
jgi:hypothetical protein